MSIATEIARITTDKTTIRNKLVNFGLAQSSANLDALATAVNGIANRGAPNAQVTEGDSYTIEPGYYSGGSVQGVAGGGSYTLQAKTATPTKQQQSIAPDAGYYGLSGVTVEAIPEAYQDVSGVTATAAHVLANDLFVAADGTLTPGTMTNNGKVTQTLSANTTSFTIPTGFHNGQGSVSINGGSIGPITPTTSQQTIDPLPGRVITQVLIGAIPAKYADVSDATGIASHVLDGDIVYSYASGVPVKIEGTMPNNGTISETIDGLSTMSYTVSAGYTSGGTVSLSDDIENALAAI